MSAGTDLHLRNQRSASTAGAHGNRFQRKRHKHTGLLYLIPKEELQVQHTWGKEEDKKEQEKQVKKTYTCLMYNLSVQFKNLVWIWSGDEYSRPLAEYGDEKTAV